MVTCGIDIGSTTIEVVLLEGQSRLGAAMVRCGYAPSQNAERMLSLLLESSGLKRKDVRRVVATGFGRNYFQGVDRVVSEIACHAAGVLTVFPEARTVIEIGGQDSKMFSVDREGRVRDFVMNDRCAAGTGRFVETVARCLNMDVEETGSAGLRARQACAISSMCAVFAETEIIGLLHQGVPVEEVLRGVFDAVARRVIGMAGRIGLTDPVVFTGGVARNVGIVQALERVTGHMMHVPDEPEFTGALGAALLAARAA
jgi:predicted CoA-substrate-specific enzyme activase